MTALKEAQSFIQKVLLQQETNRLAHGNPEADDKRQPMDWGVIVAEHTGHLLGALREGNIQAVEKEIFHVAAPLLELYNSLIAQTPNLWTFRCLSCGQVFYRLTQPQTRCPLCEGKLVQEKVQNEKVRQTTP